MNFAQAFEKGVAAATNTFEPKRFSANGKQIVCSHCANEIFTLWRGMSLAGFAIECSKCNRLEFFGKEPLEIKTEG
jgi:excinuclease UvrABC ATPase subunit